MRPGESLSSCPRSHGDARGTTTDAHVQRKPGRGRAGGHFGGPRSGLGPGPRHGWQVAPTSQARRTATDGAKGADGHKAHAAQWQRHGVRCSAASWRESPRVHPFLHGPCRGVPHNATQAGALRSRGKARPVSDSLMGLPAPPRHAPPLRQTAQLDTPARRARLCKRGRQVADITTAYPEPWVHKQAQSH